MSMGLWKCRFLSDIDFGAYIFKNVRIETFNISFGNTLKKRQCGAKVTCIEV